MAGLIYQPKGPAREYARLALNMYKGCTHGCTYCYAPEMLRKTKERYFADPDPKQDVPARVKREARSWAGMESPPEILLCFIGDPYQPAETELGLTRKVIETLIENELPFTILTKGGRRAQRDFDLIAGYPRCRFGTSLSFFSQSYADQYEPNAAPVNERIDTMAQAKSLGLETWVSLEPVIDPYQALTIIGFLHDLVDFWAIGKINHDKKLEDKVDWQEFLCDAEILLHDFDAKYYIKSSLEQYRAA